MSANGRIPRSELSPIPGGSLSAEAAHAYNALNRFLNGRLHTAGEGASYRPVGRPGDYKRGGPFTQWYAYERYQSGGNLAAIPGTSNHGAGRAVDFDSTSIPLVAKYGSRFGWAKHGDAMGEPWHYTFQAGNYPDVRKYSQVQPGNVLHPGDTGPGVVAMKKHLKKWGCWPRLWRIDNRYAGRTGAAVKAFQKSHRIKPDGIVGPRTWVALKSNPVAKVKKPLVKPKPVAAKPLANARFFADIYSNDPHYDAKAYAVAGHRMIALKATEGKTYYDAPFADRFKASSHLTRWVYHFARPHSNSPEDEASNFAKALTKVTLSPDDRLVLDWEDEKFSADGTLWVQRFVNAMQQQYGHEIRVLYSGGPYIEQTIKQWPKSKSGPLRYWHAAYNSHPEANVPAIAKPHLRAVQYTDGKLGLPPYTASGIGPCDMSYLV